MSILPKKGLFGLFIIMQQENKGTMKYLKRFNKEIFKVKCMLEPMAI
jgi:hypothetical protein